MTARAGVAAIALTALAAFCAIEVAGLRVNLSASAPIGLYRIVPGVPKRGDLVLACPVPDSRSGQARERGYLPFGLRCPGYYAPLLKTIAATTGDNVLLDGEGMVVNGRRVPGTAPLDRDGAGRPLVAAIGGPVPPRAVWLASSSHNSYDSRYFGAVPADAVMGLVKPVLWVWCPPGPPSESACGAA